jgi:hypothetical protein
LSTFATDLHFRWLGSKPTGTEGTLNETYVLEAALRQAEIWLSPGELNAEETMTLLSKKHHDLRRQTCVPKIPPVYFRKDKLGPAVMHAR